jgi:predicted glycoside hydrolase/deacetylase ChbG (UPF0249 family)
MEKPQMTARIRLITRGDDAGSSQSANRAIRECFMNGVLRNTSVMAVGPALADAAQALGHLPGLCIGLHVALNCEWEFPTWGPVLEPSLATSLLDERGCLTRTPNDLDQRHPPVEVMLNEVKAQLARLRQLGLRVEYLDQHMGVGRVGDLNAGLADLCRVEGLIDADQRFKPLPRLTASALSSTEATLERLKAAGPGTYVLITHPACDDEQMRAYSIAGHAPGQIAVQRDGDRRMLLAPELRDYAAEAGVEFVRFTDCI